MDFFIHLLGQSELGLLEALQSVEVPQSELCEEAEPNDAERVRSCLVTSIEASGAQHCFCDVRGA